MEVAVPGRDKAGKINKTHSDLINSAIANCLWRYLRFRLHIEVVTPSRQVPYATCESIKSAVFKVEGKRACSLNYPECPPQQLEWKLSD